MPKATNRDMMAKKRRALLMRGPLRPFRAIEAAGVARAMHHLAWQAAVGTRVVSSAELQLLGHVRRGPSDG